MVDIKKGMYIKVDPKLKLNLEHNNWHEVLDVKEDRVQIKVFGYQYFFVSKEAVTEIRSDLLKPNIYTRGGNEMTDLKEYVVTINYEPIVTTTTLLAHSNAHAIALAMNRVENNYDNRVSEVVVKEKGGK